MIKKTLQQITITVVTSFLEKRYQHALQNKRNNTKLKYPSKLTYKHLASSYGISPRTLSRWYRGETKTSKNVKAVRKISTQASKNIKSSRAKLARAGRNIVKESRRINTHIERLKYAHGKPTWRVHTIGWDTNQLVDFISALAKDKKGKYEYSLTLWGQTFSDGALVEGFFSSGWVSTRGKWTKEMLKRYLIREHLSRGEVHAIIFTTPK